jgi:TENA/THI-4/PQQC family
MSNSATVAAADLLKAIQRELTPAEDANRLVPLIALGKAPLAAIAALAAEEQHIVVSDRRSFFALAGRSADSAAIGFFSGLAQGETLALAKLPALAAAAGLSEDELRAYEPRAGAQAYPAFVAWLTRNAEPAEVVLALFVNFAAWGEYCATVSQALRKHYGFDDEACAFFDFFATPVPEMEEQAVAAVQTWLDTGMPTRSARRYARLLQSYELMFWNTLAEVSS